MLNDLRKKDYEKDPKNIIDGLDSMFCDIGVHGIFVDEFRNV